MTTGESLSIVRPVADVTVLGERARGLTGARAAGRGHVRREASSKLSTYASSCRRAPLRAADRRAARGGDRRDWPVVASYHREGRRAAVVSVRRGSPVRPPLPAEVDVLLADDCTLGSPSVCSFTNRGGRGSGLGDVVWRGAVTAARGRRRPDPRSPGRALARRPRLRRAALLRDGGGPCGEQQMTIEARVHGGTDADWRARTGTRARRLACLRVPAAKRSRDARGRAEICVRQRFGPSAGPLHPCPGPPARAPRSARRSPRRACGRAGYTSTPCIAAASCAPSGESRWASRTRRSTLRLTSAIDVLVSADPARSMSTP